MKNMYNERNALIKEMYDMMKRHISEKEIIESLLTDDESKKVKPIGFVRDIDSNYKNEFFDEIFEDEEGNIIDVRLYFKRPGYDDVINMQEYWIALQKTYNKTVIPFFCKRITQFNHRRFRLILNLHHKLFLNPPLLSYSIHQIHLAPLHSEDRKYLY